MNINLINLSQDTRFSKNLFDDLSHNKLTILFRACLSLCDLFSRIFSGGGFTVHGHKFVVLLEKFLGN